MYLEKIITEKIAFYKNIADIHILHGNWDEANQLLNQALSLARQLSDIKYEATLIDIVGLIRNNQGKFEEAMESYEHALNLFRSIDNKKGQGDTFHNISAAYLKKGLYDEFWKYNQKALAIQKEIEDKKGIANSLNDIGIMHVWNSDYDKALEHYEKSLAIRKELGNKGKIAGSYLNIGVVFFFRGDYDKALEYYQKSLAIKEEMGDKLAIGDVLNNIGALYYCWGDYLTGLDFLKKSLKVKKEVSLINSYGYNYAYIACINTKIGRHKQALATALEHFKNMEEVNFDAEHGRTHLAVALVIANYEENIHQDNHWTELQYLLDEISHFTQLPEIAATYFEKSIEIARHDNYYETLIPALYEYAIYLCKNGNQAVAIQHLTEAKHKAQDAKMCGELKNLDKICSELQLCIE